MEYTYIQIYIYLFIDPFLNVNEMLERVQSEARGKTAKRSGFVLERSLLLNKFGKHNKKKIIYTPLPVCAHAILFWNFL